MLRVTKYTHSCVLVETDDRVGLFDPGKWASYNIDSLPNIDRIVYTHEHGDHLDIDKLKELLVKNPHAHVVCNDSIKAIIEEAGIEAVIRDETHCTRAFISPHEELPIEDGFHFKDVFSHPGDSYQFSESKPVLAMPFVGPWGSLKEGINAVLALKTKPEIIIPIHDWHFSQEGRDWNDGVARGVLKEHGITVLSSDSGITHELEG